MSSSIQSSGAPIQSLLACIVRDYFKVIDRAHQTYCLLNSQVIQATLARFGVTSSLVPCQLLGMTDNSLFFVGFVGRSSATRWDGHAVCITDEWCIDAAVSHVRIEGKMDVPSAVMAPRVQGPKTRLLAHLPLHNGVRLQWLEPPSCAEPSVPHEPTSVVDAMATALADHVNRNWVAGGGQA